jgi:hypothetical protein
MSTQIGEVEIFSQWPNGPMWTGNGPRQVSTEIKFRCPFPCVPKVIATINTLDSSKDANLRVRVTCSAVTTAGFTVTAATWADTKLAVVGVSWMAYL